MRTENKKPISKSCSSCCERYPCKHAVNTLVTTTTLKSKHANSGSEKRTMNFYRLTKRANVLEYKTSEHAYD